MDLSTLSTLFEATFDREALTEAGRRLGAFERERKVTVFDFVLALVSAGCVGPERSIAAVRRAWELLAGETIAPKSFDAHFNPGMVRLLWELIHDVMAPSNRALRRSWPAPLRDLYDVLIVDGTRMAVDSALAEVLRDTTPGKAALKLLGVLSLGDGHLTDVRAGAAVHHDRKLLRLGTLLAGALYLLDLGFYDHDLFAGYADANAFFASRLKDSAMPRIDAVVTGVAGGAAVVGQRLDGARTYGPVVEYKQIHGRSLKGHEEPDGLTPDFFQDGCPTERSSEEPEHLLPADFVRDRLYGLVRKGVEGKKLSLAQAAEVLRIPLADMVELENSWTAQREEFPARRGSRDDRAGAQPCELPGALLAGGRDEPVPLRLVR